MVQSAYSEHSVTFGSYEKVFWNWSGDNSKVPAGQTLVVTSITLNYFPADGGTVGRADVTGRDGAGTAVWRLQIVYVEPKKTKHLPFPLGLRLEADGYVEVGFIDDGPGEVFVSLNGQLTP
jgi:hypothetical protein